MGPLVTKVSSSFMPSPTISRRRHVVFGLSEREREREFTRACEFIYTVSQKNWATFIFTVTLSNVGRF